MCNAVCACGGVANRIAKAQEMVKKIMASPPKPDDKHRRALAEAILTPPQAQTAAHKELLAILLA